MTLDAHGVAHRAARPKPKLTWRFAIGDAVTVSRFISKYPNQHMAPSTSRRYRVVGKRISDQGIPECRIMGFADELDWIAEKCLEPENA